MDEPTSRPTSPQENLWDSILNSVSSRRSVPSGNVLILGEPSTGKSTLANALLQRNDSRVENGTTGDKKLTSDFALGYQWTNVKEEGDEDVVARLSVYSVPSSSPAHLSLVPHFLPPKASLPRTLVVIVLDWTKPWSFLDQLATWLTWIEEWAQSDKSREAQIIREECHDRLQAHLQHYVEPSPPNAAPIDALSTVTSSINSTLLPLGSGTFTHNAAGVPIVIVCSKADLIDEEEDVALGTLKGKGGEWEERSDAAMQVLRTIALKYGAALFYTTPQPPTLSLLRQYVLHLLFAPGPPPPDSAPLKYPFPFAHRPNTLDRDRIVVPAGWDSWGKIAVLRDGFDAARWGEAWERDLDADKGAVVNGGARMMFRELVGEDRGPKLTPLPALITTEPDQSFLSTHFEALSKDPARDPRQQFRHHNAAGGGADGQAGDAFGAGVVGPMGGSSTLSLPSVRAAMGGGDGDDVASRLLKGSTAGPPPRRTDPRSALPNPIPNLIVPTMPSSGATSAPLRPTSTSQRVPPSPSPIGGSGGADGRSQHDVLQSFFASLLTNRTGAASPGPSPTLPGTGPASPTLGATTNGQGTRPRKTSENSG